MVERLSIVGIGSIGSSLALALRRQGQVGTVVGCDPDTPTLQDAQAWGVIDVAEPDPARAVDGADMVILAVPVGATETVLRAIRPGLGAQTVITDVGSVKGAVLAAAQAVFGAVPAGFVPGHPIAGTERSGLAAARADLFDGCQVILTPAAETAAEASQQVRDLWERLGAEVVEMSAEHHDEVLAATSHLPHLLAYALVDTLARMEERSEVFRFAAGGFRDFTRIASSDPVMWRDICLANGPAVEQILERFEADLQAVRVAVARGDGAALEALFTRAKTARDTFCVQEGVR